MMKNVLQVICSSTYNTQAKAAEEKRKCTIYIYRASNSDGNMITLYLPLSNPVHIQILIS